MTLLIVSKQRIDVSLLVALIHGEMVQKVRKKKKKKKNLR